LRYRISTTLTFARCEFFGCLLKNSNQIRRRDLFHCNTISPIKIFVSVVNYKRKSPFFNIKFCWEIDRKGASWLVVIIIRVYCSTNVISGDFYTARKREERNVFLYGFSFEVLQNVP
jgi:hypothetical protein